MAATSFYPVLMSQGVAAAAAFYRDFIGFETTYDSDWYVSLRLGSFELGLVAGDHETIPELHRAAPRGVILNLEVDDVDAVHARFVAAGLTPVLELRTEDFGQRHFMIVGPDAVLLDVIQPTQPTAEFADAYLQA